MGASNASDGEILQAHPASPLEGDGFLEYRPASSIRNPGADGNAAHTNLRLLLPPAGVRIEPLSPTEVRALNSDAQPSAAPPVTYLVNTPSSIACVYELATQPKTEVAGCSPAHTTAVPAGGRSVIAIVDAYDDATAATDLAYFSKYYELPTANFAVVYAGGAAPAYSTGPRPPSGAANGWNLEESLDIEWAHALAPGAKIILIEAADSSSYSMRLAVQTAIYHVYHDGGGEVSMSWSLPESSVETIEDSLFSGAPGNVAFFAAAGDVGGEVSWPAASPYVTGVGGTTINRNSAGAFVNETSWTSGGGGISAFEPRPSYQNLAAIESVVGAFRGTPDVSFDANPSSGVSVYTAGKWVITGGTSFATPALAAIENVATGKSFWSSTDVVESFYNHGASKTYFRDVLSGTCGSLDAKAGYDLCTGWGSPLTYVDK